MNFGFVVQTTINGLGGEIAFAEGTNMTITQVGNVFTFTSGGIGIPLDNATLIANGSGKAEINLSHANTWTAVQQVPTLYANNGDIYSDSNGNLLIGKGTYPAVLGVSQQVAGGIVVGGGTAINPLPGVWIFPSGGTQITPNAPAGVLLTGCKLFLGGGATINTSNGDGLSTTITYLKDLTHTGTLTFTNGVLTAAT